MNCCMTNLSNSFGFGAGKTQIALASTLIDRYSLCTQVVVKCLSFRHAISEDSDQTGRKSRLIGVFPECRVKSVGFIYIYIVQPHYSAVFWVHMNRLLFIISETML